MSSRKTWLLLLLIVLLGASLRFQAIISTVVDQPIRADARIYYSAALNLERWGIFSRQEPGESPPKPDAFVPPGLPSAIAPLIEYPPTNRSLLKINAVQALWGTLTIVLTFLFFNLFTRPGIALGAALLTALSPHLVVMTTYLLTETLFTLLLLGGLVSWAYGLQRQRLAWALCGGLLLGFSALTRATTEYLPLFLLPLLFFATERKVFLRFILPPMLAAAAVVLAWKIRNLLATGMVGDPSLMLNALHHGMYPGFMFNGMPESLGMPYRYDPFTQEIHGPGSIVAEIFHRAAADPLSYFSWYVIGKPISLLSWNMVDGIGDIFLYPIVTSPYLHNPLFTQTRLLVFGLHAPLSLAAIGGLITVFVRPTWLGLTGEQRFPAQVTALLVLYFFAIHFVGAPYPRYGIPLRPLIYGFGLLVLTRVISHLITRMRTR